MGTAPFRNIVDSSMISAVYVSLVLNIVSISSHTAVPIGVVVALLPNLVKLLNERAPHEYTYHHYENNRD